MANRSNRPDLSNRKFMVNVVSDTLRGGRQYRPEFARFVGDKEAYIDSKSEAVALLKRRGWSCRGTVDVESEVPPPPDNYTVADDVVQKEIGEINDKEHGGQLSRKKKDDLFHALKEKRSGAQD